MKKYLIYTFKIFTLAVIVAAAIFWIFLKYNDARAATNNNLDSEIISVIVKNTPYSDGLTKPIELITDEVFSFKVTMKNTGTSTWRYESSHGASLLSRGPDFNSIFGTFFILMPKNNENIIPSGHITYNTYLKAPSVPGIYTMRWQHSDWPVGNRLGSGNDHYSNRPFFGEEIVVRISVNLRSENPPNSYVSSTSGIININDFVYEGTFLLPIISPYSNTGITIRKVGDEKRIIYADGAWAKGQAWLYELKIPTEIGKIEDGDTSQVSEALIRTIFTGDNNLSVLGGYWSAGNMWYDNINELLYWTNYNWYQVSGVQPTEPVLYWGKIDGDKLIRKGKWSFPSNVEGPYKGYWGGVTVVPESLKAAFGGRKLALGFGGNFSGNSSASMGPSLSAVSVDNTGTPLQDDLMPIIYYPGASNVPSVIINNCVRDGNYFNLVHPNNNPISPWEGKWQGIDTVGSGVFIDLPDKKGYIAFVNQVKGRYGYDYGGTNFIGKRQNSWYFYDFDSLKKSATARTPSSRLGLIPSSHDIVEYPHDYRLDSPSVIGSSFDEETRLLYVMTTNTYYSTDLNTSNKNYPAIHVYRILYADNDSGVNASPKGYSSGGKSIGTAVPR